MIPCVITIDGNGKPLRIRLKGKTAPRQLNARKRRALAPERLAGLSRTSTRANRRLLGVDR